MFYKCWLMILFSSSVSLTDFVIVDQIIIKHRKTKDWKWKSGLPRDVVRGRTSEK